jgi:FlaG/FlaF family flagellin (archaellin)
MKIREDAVSPVVGVLLMPGCTIIIAAIVSGFAGGLTSGQQKAPSISITKHTKLVNSGYYHDSGLILEVTGSSEPIPTKDLKIYHCMEP